MNAQTNTISKRAVINWTAEFGFFVTLALLVIDLLSATVASAGPSSLKPPAQGRIPIAFVISEGAVVIDFCGPWEVFGDVYIPGRPEAPFELYTVSDSTTPI